MTDKPINDGGPAYPSIGNVAHNSDWMDTPRMSLRAWLTARYGAAIITALYKVAMSTDTFDQFHKTMIEQAMALADDTIAALNSEAPRAVDIPPGE